MALFPILTGVFEHDIYDYLLFTAIFGVTLLSLYPKLSEPARKKMSLSADLYVPRNFVFFCIFHQSNMCN